MANTYTQIYIHVIFAVESRQNLIAPEHNDELQKYLTGIITEQRHKLIAINNMPDHLHVLIGMRPDAALSDLVNDMKTGSSKFINGKRWVVGRFSWQHGFGAFSHSRSQLGTVIRYIQNQPQHHAKNRSAPNICNCLTNLVWSMTNGISSNSSAIDGRNMPLLRSLKNLLCTVTTNITVLWTLIC